MEQPPLHTLDPYSEGITGGEQTLSVHPPTSILFFSMYNQWRVREVAVPLIDLSKHLALVNPPLFTLPVKPHRQRTQFCAAINHATER